MVKFLTLLFTLFFSSTLFSVTSINANNDVIKGINNINDTTSIKHEVGNWTATYYGNTYKTVRRTANGDVFNMNAMTCAAPKSYKFGTKLKITNLSNGKTVIVTVTDRGGFGNRTIDLTYGAFGKIANHRSGRIKITVQVLK